MAAVTFWLTVLFLVLIPKLSKGDSGQYSEMECELHEIFGIKCEEKEEYEKSVLAAALSALKVMENVIRNNCELKLLGMKEKFQAIIVGQRKKAEENIQKLQELLEKQK